MHSYILGSQQYQHASDTSGSKGAAGEDLQQNALALDIMLGKGGIQARPDSLRQLAHNGAQHIISSCAPRVEHPPGVVQHGAWLQQRQGRQAGDARQACAILLLSTILTLS